MIKLTEYVSSAFHIETWVNPGTIERVFKPNMTKSELGFGCTLAFVSGRRANYEEDAEYVVSQVEANDSKTP